METREIILQVLRRLYAKRKQILIATAIAAIVSAVTALLLPVYYTSSATMHVASVDMSKPEMIFGKTDRPMNYYGSDEDRERMLDVGKSAAFIDSVLLDQDLYSYYDFDVENKRDREQIRDKFKSLFSFKENKHKALEASYMDKDPEKAYRILSSIVFYLKKLGSVSIKTSQRSILALYNKNIEQTLNEIDFYTDSLSQLQKNSGVVDGESQKKSLGQYYSKILRGKAKAEARVAYFESSGRRDSLHHYRVQLEKYQNEYELITGDSGMKSVGDDIIKIESIEEALSSLEELLQEINSNKGMLKSTLEAELPVLHITEEASVPNLKSWPPRTIIVALSTILVFCFLCMYYLIRASNKTIRWSEIKG